MSKSMQMQVPGLVPLSFLSLVLLSLFLGGCATGAREGPPAPVVSVTPRQPPAAVLEPPVEAKPKAQKPAVPAKPETRTYAYQEPGTEPDPEPAAPAGPAPAQAPVPAAPEVSRPAAVAQRPAPPAVPTGVEPKPAQRATAPPDGAPPAAPTSKPETQVASAKPPSAPSTPPPVSAPAATPAPAERPLTPTLPPAADGLARQAEQQRQQGDYAGAAATLERSLRIAPREAYLWNRLARVRMEQGLSAQAGQLAGRSNDLAGNQGNIKQDNWRIIAESRRRAGDMAGASEAEQRAGGG